MNKELGHNFLARLGKTKLRPGGAEATDWLLENAHITKDTKILEVACNMGTNMIHLATQYGCQVIGLDMDKNALEKAKKNIQEHHLEDQLSVIEGNAFSLPFADQSFDVVINEAMLTMLNDEGKNKAISEYARVLKPNGILLTHDVCLRTNDEKSIQSLKDQLSRIINVKVNPLTLEDWKELLESHHFDVTQKSGDMTLMDPTGMIKDEGAANALKILSNALKKENREMFFTMFDFFNDHKAELGYVAHVSIKQ